MVGYSVCSRRDTTNTADINDVCTKNRFGLVVAGSHYLLNFDNLKASAVLITSTYACNSKRLAVTFRL